MALTHYCLCLCGTVGDLSEGRPERLPICIRLITSHSGRTFLAQFSGPAAAQPSRGRFFSLCP